MKVGRLRSEKDAFGHAAWDFHRYGTGEEIVERDDGYIRAVSMAESVYFADFAEWPDAERRAMRYVRGRVLDVGCGPGRVGLHLGAKGFEVLGIDVSPLSVKVAKERGAGARVGSIDALPGPREAYDTVVMFGNNLGLLGTSRRSQRILARLDELTTPQARIIAETLNPYLSPDRQHRAYRAANRRKGLLPGQVKLRIRYRQYSTDWFDFMFLSPDELSAVLQATSWELKRVLQTTEDNYVAVIEKR